MGGALRIVVVDNDPDALDLAATDLRLEGHDVVGQALDGVRALELVRDLRPDVLVVDHRMPPGPWGLEVAERLAREQAGTRVIVYSNYQSVELIKRTRAAGATFLPKGNLRSLRRAVRRVAGDQAAPSN
jgi:CheY-like chemotaxis protein